MQTTDDPSTRHHYPGPLPADHTWPGWFAVLGWWHGVARRVIAAALLVGLVWDLVETTRVVDRAIAAGASAIQVTELYAGHLYSALVLIGLAFALYVWTRGWDRPGD